MIHVALALAALAAFAAQQPPPLPSSPMAFGAFTATFDSNGTFILQGQGWPAFKGTWKSNGPSIELTTPDAAGGCDKPGRYTYGVAGGHVTFEVVADECVPRRMILDRSDWRPSGEAVRIPAHRSPYGTAARVARRRAASGARHGSWPSFRGRRPGVADGQNLPDRWDVAKGENVLAHAIPGLAHSSRSFWGDRVFVTSASART